MSSGLLHFCSPLLYFVGEVPHGFTGHGVVVELLAVGVFVLFPLGMLKDLLGGLEALRHLVLGLFCGFVVVVGEAPHRGVDRPHFALLLEGDWVLVHYQIYYKIKNV